MANIRNVNLNLLLVFDALMQEGHLSRAGQRIGLSQPGMSYSLKQLRELFHDPLFIKSKQGMHPTEKSLAIYSLIQSALSQVNDAIEYGKSFNPKSSEYNYRLGLSDYASYILLPNLYHDVNKLSPNISFTISNLSSPEKSHLLDDNEIDLAIAVYNSKPKRLEHVELFREKIVCLFDPKIIKVSKKLTIKQFIQYPHLLVDFREDPPLAIKSILERHGLTRKVAMTVPHVVATGRIVKGTDLISAVPLRIAEVIAHQYNLAISHLPIKIQDYGVYLVWHKRNNKKLEHQWLREKIRELLS